MKYVFPQAFEVPNKPSSDFWYKKLILRVYGSVLPFKVGDKVLIQSDRYNGVHEIGYIYRGVSAANGSFWNLYFDLPFDGDTSGTVDTDPAATAEPVLTVVKNEPVNTTEPSPEQAQSLTNKAVSTAEQVVDKVVTTAETAVKTTTTAISGENTEETATAKSQLKKWLLWLGIIVAGLIVYKKFIKK